MNVICLMGYNFVEIPSGRYTIGGESRGEICPKFSVDLRGFYISQYPVSKGMWMKINSINNTNEVDNYFPVTNVSIYEAKKFISTLSLRLNKPCRLPSLAELTVAMHAGSCHGNYEKDENILTPSPRIIGMPSISMPSFGKNVNRYGLGGLGIVPEYVLDSFDMEDSLDLRIHSDMFHKGKIYQMPIFRGWYRISIGGDYFTRDNHNASLYSQKTPQDRYEDVGFRIVLDGVENLRVYRRSSAIANNIAGLYGIINLQDMRLALELSEITCWFIEELYRTVHQVDWSEVTTQWRQYAAARPWVFLLWKESLVWLVDGSTEPDPIGIFAIFMHKNGRCGRVVVDDELRSLYAQHWDGRDPLREIFTLHDDWQHGRPLIDPSLRSVRMPAYLEELAKKLRGEAVSQAAMSGKPFACWVDPAAPHVCLRLPKPLVSLLKKAHAGAVDVPADRARALLNEVVHRVSGWCVGWVDGVACCATDVPAEAISDGTVDRPPVHVLFHAPDGRWRAGSWPAARNLETLVDELIHVGPGNLRGDGDDPDARTVATPEKTMRAVLAMMQGEGA